MTCDPEDVVDEVPGASHDLCSAGIGIAAGNHLDILHGHQVSICCHLLGTQEDVACQVGGPCTECNFKILKRFWVLQKRVLAVGLARL